MKTPREKYEHDPQYRELVNIMESFIERAQYTPSELREAAMMAAINYEYRRPSRNQIIPEVSHALDVLDRHFVNRRQGKG